MEDFPERIGYACLCTVLRKRKPTVFCSRTARISTIKDKGIEYLKELGRKNVTDLLEMIEWNEEHNIKFMRMSSDMFPFASHELYGYSLEYADNELKNVGELAKRLNHRLTAHPCQANNLGSPTPSVIQSTILDLTYHAEMMDRMNLPADSVMIIHLGGKYNSKEATLKRWAENFTMLPNNVQKRLVLENDEICYNTEELLSLCEKLDIPLVFDWHHHRLNPGTIPLAQLLERVAAIWKKRGIRQKMHYSESRPEVTEEMSMTKRRAHSEYVNDIPMCGKNVDLMIEAKMKEQAVLDIYKKYNIKH